MRLYGNLTLKILRPGLACQIQPVLHFERRGAFTLSSGNQMSARKKEAFGDVLGGTSEGEGSVGGNISSRLDYS